MFAHPSRKLFLSVLVVLFLGLVLPPSVVGQAENQAIIDEFSAFNPCSDLPEIVQFVATYRVFALDSTAEFSTVLRHFRLNIQAHGVGELSGTEYSYCAQRWAFVDVSSDQPPVDQRITISGEVISHGRTANFTLQGVLQLGMDGDSLNVVRFEPSSASECRAH